jgi:hypothetical protein
MPYGYTQQAWGALSQAERTKAAQSGVAANPTVTRRQTLGGSGVGGSRGVGTAAIMPRQPSAAVPAPAMPTYYARGAGAAAAGGSSAPPTITDLEIKGQADPRLTGYAERYGEHLGKLEEGKTREAELFKENIESDAERQVAQARESALAAGQPWTAQDEERMRSELKRRQYGATAEFELGSQRDTTAALQGGLGIMEAPFQSQMAEKGLSQGTQKMLMDYAIQRGGLVSEDKKTAVMEAGQALDAYQGFLSMLGSPSFNFSSSFS